MDYLRLGYFYLDRIIQKRQGLGIIFKYLRGWLRYCGVGKDLIVGLLPINGKDESNSDRSRQGIVVYELGHG